MAMKTAVPTAKTCTKPVRPGETLQTEEKLDQRRLSASVNKGKEKLRQRRLCTRGAAPLK